MWRSGSGVEAFSRDIERFSSLFGLRVTHSDLRRSSLLLLISGSLGASGLISRSKGGNREVAGKSTGLEKVISRVPVLFRVEDLSLNLARK